PGWCQGRGRMAATNPSPVCVSAIPCKLSGSAPIEAARLQPRPPRKSLSWALAGTIVALTRPTTVSGTSRTKTSRRRAGRAARITTNGEESRRKEVHRERGCEMNPDEKLAIHEAGHAVIIERKSER